MMSLPPLHLSALFIMLVFGIAFFLFLTVYTCGRRSNLSPEKEGANILRTLSIIFGWLVFVLIISLTGFLQDFQAVPPRILYIVLPPFIGVLLLPFYKNAIALLDKLPHFWLIYTQSFRIIIGVMLWMLCRYEIIPTQMTFEGMNLDILTGISAPFVAYYCFRKKTWSPKIALIWNIFGLLTLANMMVLFLLSSPYPFRYFMNEPTNAIQYSLPFVWLPTFVMPFAFLLHVLSIHRLIRKTDGSL
ncbi:MAG: hypothetical protein IPP77_14680 [Bacteroidetes bacterium]|nr:hypothetical protein [Bacteroidota bacterium]